MLIIILWFKLLFGKIDNLIKLQDQLTSNRNLSSEKIIVKMSQSTHICKFLEPWFGFRNQANNTKVV